MSVARRDSTKASPPNSPSKSPYSIQLSPSKELLQQYAEDPNRASILPMIEKKMNYSHKPRRSVLASYERLAEYRDLVENDLKWRCDFDCESVHMVEFTTLSPERDDGRSPPRKSKMPLNLMLMQDQVDAPNPLGSTIRTTSAAKDSDHSSTSRQAGSIAANKRNSGVGMQESPQSRTEYFGQLEQSFKLVEPKKYNVLPIQEVARSRPSRFAQHAARSSSPPSTSIGIEFHKIYFPLIISPPEGSRVQPGPFTAESLHASVSQKMEHPNKGNLSNSTESAGKSGFFVRPQHRGYLEVTPSNRSEKHKRNPKAGSKTTVDAQSPHLSNSKSTANSRNCSLKKIVRGLDGSWSKVYGLGQSNPSSAEGSILTAPTTNLLGRKYILLEQRNNNKSLNAISGLSSANGGIQMRSKPDIIVIPKHKSLKRFANVSGETISKILPPISTECTPNEVMQPDNEQLEICFQLAEDLKQALVLLLKFAESHQQPVDTVIQRIFGMEATERGLRMTIRSILGPDDQHVRTNPELRVDLLKIMEFMNINHGSWKANLSKQKLGGYITEQNRPQTPIYRRVIAKELYRQVYNSSFVANGRYVQLLKLLLVRVSDFLQENSSQSTNGEPGLKFSLQRVQMYRARADKLKERLFAADKEQGGAFLYKIPVEHTYNA